MKNERGAIIIQVAVCLLGVMAFSAFVVDYGIMWSSRAQVQTAADAAALSGAVTLAFDNTKDFAKAKLHAQKIGQLNYVWGQAPDIQLADITFPACPPSGPGYGPDTCVKADAYRNQTRSNGLPTFFANLVGVNSQGVRATATARAVAANATNCLKPWAVGDKWLDSQVGGWSQTATYDPAAGDSYVPPTATSPGTGFTEHDASGNPSYYGYQMVLKLANPGQGSNQIPINSAGWAMELCLNNAASNNPCNTPAYSANITDCSSDIVAISPENGTCNAVDPSIGCLGIKTGSTGAINSKAVGDFIAANDPTATWSDGPGTNGWQTGKINTTQSPSNRIVPIAVFDVPEYLAAGYNGSNGIIRIVNIVGFFLEGTCQTVSAKESYLECPGGGNDKSAIVGRLVSYPGLNVPSGGTVTGSFGSVIILVR
jgi:hypothetical protein